MCALLLLQLLANEQQYKEVANLLDAVKQFMTHFDSYMHISMIQGVHNRVSDIRSRLIDHIGGLFKKLAEVPTPLQ